MLHCEGSGWVRISRWGNDSERNCCADEARWVIGWLVVVEVEELGTSLCLALLFECRFGQRCQLAPSFYD